MIAYQTSDFGTYHRYPKSHGGSCKDSIISLSTSETKSTRSKYSVASVPSSRSSFSTSRRDTIDSPRRYRFDAAPKLVKTPWEADRAKRQLAKKWAPDSLAIPRPVTSRMKTLPPRFFETLPREVYECIVEQLAHIHESAPTGLCMSCYLADVSSLCLTSRSFAPFARRQLYQNIWLPLDDATFHQPKTPPFLRFKQLRRTLRSSPMLALTVKSVHIPGMQSLYKRSHPDDRKIIESQVASLVMACPELEELTGLCLDFDHDFDRLTYALSTRRHLKTRVWKLKGIEDCWDQGGNLLTNARPTAYDGSIMNDDVFLQSHELHTNLQTLLLFGQTTGNLDYRAFVGTFRKLPNLKNLVLSNFDKKQLNDRTVAALPQNLHSLRLQDLPGVSERGLRRLASSSHTLRHMRSLSIINLEITSAQLIIQFLSTCIELRTLTLVQSTSPSLPTSGSNSQPLAPIYSSKSLRFLHWDISPFPQPSLTHVATSIISGSLPSLSGIRAPCDDGTLQAICRPRSVIARPSDFEAHSRNQSTLLSLRTPLSMARIAAQERLEAKRHEPLMKVVVSDERGIIQHKYTVKNYMGSIASPIHYVLEGNVRENGLVDSGVVEVDAMFKYDELTPRNGIRALFMGKEAVEACCGPSVPEVPTLNGTRPRKDSLNKGHRVRERVRHVDTSAFF